jgi:GAF domain-containing protein
LKVYRPARELLSEIGRRLAAKNPLSHKSPLEDVAELLACGRHYSWVGIYLAVAGDSTQQLLGARGEPQPAQMARPETRSKLLVSMKLAGRELGVLDVESDREHAFGSEDRVLLENVADLLARFLTGRGEYLVRHAREAVADSNSRPSKTN